jgi:hypothetical protein
MSRASNKAQTVVVAINPDSLSDAIAGKVASMLDVKYGKQLAADGRRQVDPLSESIPDFAIRVGTSRWTIRREVREGVIEAIKIGDTVRVTNPAEQAKRYLQSRPVFEASTGGSRATVKRDPKGKFEAPKSRRPAMTQPVGEIHESEI